MRMRLPQHAIWNMPQQVRLTHVLVLCAVMLFVSACGVRASDGPLTPSNQPVVTDAGTTEVSQTPQRDRLRLLRTETPTPVVYPDLIEPERRPVWQDDFSGNTGGWEQAQQTNNRNGSPITQYNNGFLVINTDESATMTVNSRFQLPLYPYVIDAEVAAARDSYGVLAIDYVGDPRNIDESAGLFVTYSLNAQRDERAFAAIDSVRDRYLQPTRNSYTFVEYFGHSAWQLPCRIEIEPTPSRTATISLFVDQHAVLLTQRTSESTTVGRIVCQRIGNRPVGTNGLLGVGGISNRARSPVAFTQNQLLVNNIVVSTIPRMPAIEAVTTSANQIVGCENDPTVNISWILTDPTDEFTCGPGPDIDTRSFVVQRYPDTMNDTVGVWQCGRDPEDRMTLRWDGTHILAEFEQGRRFHLIPVVDTASFSSDVFYLLSPFPREDQTAAVRPGDHIFREYDLLLKFTDGAFVSRWAGTCTQQLS